ncbi:MAG: hypothetical protein ACLVEV_03265 [Lachnospiraceae bacterium]
MIAKKILTIAALAAGMALLGGCGMLEQKKWTPQEPAAISIAKDGSITEIVQESLDESYYDAAELEKMITDEVSKYNAQNGEDSVTVKKLEHTDGVFRLQMEYASADDYAAFNHTEFYYGSMINAQLEGYLFDVPFKKVKDGVVQGSPVTGSEVIKQMGDQVLILRAPLEVQVPGNVLFTSTNTEVLSSDVVNATGESEEDEKEGLVLPSSAVYHGEEASYEEQEAAKRAYIIFEME